MAEDSARDRRAASRERRRSNGQDDSANGHEGVDASAALKAAASAALAGAAVGAAQAMRSRRAAQDEEPEQEKDQQPDVEPEEEQEQEPEPQASEPEPEPASDEGEEEQESTRPMHGSEAKQIVERARQQIRDLRGAEAESVSSIRRTSDGWCVALEIVELHRIPDSTDVLGTYDVVLDDDGNLLTLQRTARYYRSEADRGER